MKSLCATAYPRAGNFLQQELALITGAVDLMTVDVQCRDAGTEDCCGMLSHETHYNIGQGKDRRRGAYRIPPGKWSRYGKTDIKEGH